MSNVKFTKGYQDASSLFDNITLDITQVVDKVLQASTLLDISFAVSPAIEGVAVAAAGATAVAYVGIFIGAASAALGPLLVIGLPVMEAKQEIQKRQAEWGFCVGIVAASFRYDSRAAKSLQLSNHTRTFAHPAVQGVAAPAHNQGLALGFATGVQMNLKALDNFRENLTNVMVSKGYGRAMQYWTDNDMILNYARELCNIMKSSK